MNTLNPASILQVNILWGYDKSTYQTSECVLGKTYIDDFFTVKLHYIVHTMKEQFGLIGYPVVLLTFYR